MKIYPYINKFKQKGINYIAFKKIKFINTLGTGASSLVYHGLINDRNYCIKQFISDEYNTIEDMFELLTFEIYNIHTMNYSDNFPTLCGISYRQSCKKLYIYIITEYNLGTISLHKYINNPKNWKNNSFILDTSSIIQQIIHRVSELHMNYIVHADLKLDNMVIDTNHKIILIDFGASCILDGDVYDNSEYDEFLGTEGYMAPEQYYYKIRYESDIYSLSICIIELLTGSIWINANEYDECRQEIMNSLQKIQNTKYKEILLKGISEDYSKRPSIHEFIQVFH